MHKVQCLHYTITQNHILSFASKKERQQGLRDTSELFPFHCLWVWMFWVLCIQWVNTLYVLLSPFMILTFPLWFCRSFCCYPPCHAKSLQSWLTLHNTMDGSLPGSSVHGILQARILEWVAMRSSRSPPNQGIKPEFLMSPELANRSLTTSTTWEANNMLLNS